LSWPICASSPLYPAELAEMSVEAFLAELPKSITTSGVYGALGGVPRYMAEVGPEGGVVVAADGRRAPGGPTARTQNQVRSGRGAMTMAR